MTWQPYSKKMKPLFDDKTVKTGGYLVNSGKVQRAVEELSQAEIEYHKRGMELVW
jgi:hypothetical protein